MNGRFAILAAAATAVLTATPALAAQENPIGGQMGGMWTQEAPTGFFSTEMGAVLAPRVQYISGGGPGINFRYGLGGGGEFGLGVNAMFNTTTNLNAGLSAGYKQQLTRAGNMAMAFNVGGSVGGIGTGGAVPVGLMAGLPMTFDIGTSLLSIYPNFRMPNVSGGTAGATVNAGIGLQAPLANFWSFLGEVNPGMALGTNTFQMPITAGARLSPTAMSHVDFTVANMTVTPGFGLTVGTVGVTGHVGFR